MNKFEKDEDEVTGENKDWFSRAIDRFDWKNENCENEKSGWCKLPKVLDCKNCLEQDDGSRACEVKL